MRQPVKIRVDLATREALKASGRKGESYDVVIRRLVKYWVLEELHWDAGRILDLLGEEEEGEG